MGNFTSEQAWLTISYTVGVIASLLGLDYIVNYYSKIIKGECGGLLNSY